MIKINPYINLPGTASDAIELYKQVFQVEPDAVSRYDDMPPGEDMPPLTPAGAERILHASFKLGNDSLMISDAPEGQDDSVILGTQTSISVHPDSREEADRMFGLLSEGGHVVMPMEDAFWGDYFGMCADRFGVSWMINYHEEK